MKRIILLIIVVLLIAGGASAAWVYSELRRPIAHNKSGQYIEIPRGSSPSSIIKKLADEGIIKHEWPLKFYLKGTGRGSTLKAGEYDFPSPVSPMQVLAKLQQGERRLTRLTIPEGWTRWDIAKAMMQVPELHLESDAQALELMNNVSLISDLDPVAKNLEGYLFPDTYEFSPETTPAELVEMMVQRFRDVWKPEWTNRATGMSMSVRELVTTASIIETEAKLDDERPIVASVIYNRLKKDIPLAVDSSIVYASKLEGKWRYDGKVYKSDIERRSPYNTRIYAGLPPGPVASPGESSLKAALNPAQSDYLYYVRNPDRDDGAHNFYSNGSDFETGVQALRRWERERDAENARKKRENDTQ
ncbi:MAG TPA: endolytic transglycosylase MltG, partial [Pyrinomonadaceae bacterium]|nr:endolytic transglycosylase MltG [Pyrinomonadaceae bacterium]